MARGLFSARPLHEAMLTFVNRTPRTKCLWKWNQNTKKNHWGNVLTMYMQMPPFRLGDNGLMIHLMIVYWILRIRAKIVQDTHNIHFLKVYYFIVRRAGLLLSQQDFEWRWSVPLFQCLTVLEFSFILFDLCLLITFFNFIMNYVPIVTFWIFTYHKIWILSIMFCFIWSYWIIYFLACL